MDIATIAGNNVSEEDYLKLEASSDQKHEYEDGKIIAMGGASFNHNDIVFNIGGLLFPYSRIIKNFKVRSNDLRVYCEALNRYYYPDLVISLKPKKIKDNDFNTLLNPQIIIEVLSKSTAEKDRSSKFEVYRTIPSLQEYVLVNQYEARIESFYKDDKNTWVVREPIAGLESIFTFQTCAIELPLNEVYFEIEM